jgi:hypothetical protein
MAAVEAAAPLSAQELDAMLAECVALRLLITNHQDVTEKVEALLPRLIAAVNELQCRHIVCP